MKRIMVLADTLINILYKGIFMSSNLIYNRQDGKYYEP